MVSPEWAKIPRGSRGREVRGASPPEVDAFLVLRL